jgi:hypothetical protein
VARLSVVDVGNVKPLIPKRWKSPNDREQHEQSERAREIQCHARAATGHTADAVGREAEREHRTEQQSAEARVRRVVRVLDAVVRRDRAQHRRREGYTCHREQHPLTTELAQAEHEQRRPDEIELLFDRERPEVFQDGRAARVLKVGAVGDDLPPVCSCS